MKKDIQLRDVQLVILDIFKEIIRVCDKNNIAYFIIGGIALGAVRHNGFIPWDDDLDIGMTRENYNYFLKIAQDELPVGLFLQTFKTESESPFYFAKIRKNGTKFVENYCRKLNMHHGIYVDIFPYDNIPDNVGLRRKQRKKVNLWSQLFIAKSVSGSSIPQNTLTGKLKVVIRTIVHLLLRPVSKKFLFERLDLVSQEYNNIPCKMKSFVKTPCLMIPSADLENLETIEFEGISVSCPRNIEGYLKHNFGDFRSLPPENKRVGHRPYRLEL